MGEPIWSNDVYRISYYLFAIIPLGIRSYKGCDVLDDKTKDWIWKPFRWCVRRSYNRLGGPHTGLST